MAVTAAPAPGPAAFARLKLRVLRNSMRGQPWRVAMFWLGAVLGLAFAVVGFTGFAAAAGNRTAALLVPAIGGAVLVLGWLFLPLLFFGVDETLDPARFALLPLPRWTLLRGMLGAALLGVPAISTLLATAGIAFGVGLAYGPLAGGLQLIGVLAGLLLCVLTSRAVTSAFAGLLRSRRTRDLAAIVLAGLAAAIGPLQVAVIAAAGSTDADQLVGPARVLGWTPLAAPYTIGLEVADARPGAALAKLAITAATVALLAWWWSRTLEPAMLVTTSGGTARTRGGRGGPVRQLYPALLGWLPRNRFGALVAREVRYWWRDARRRANLVTIGVVGVFLPVVWSFSSSTTGQLGVTTGGLAISMLFVGTVAALTLANQFGFDGSAYAVHVVAGVPGRAELGARALGYAAYIVPMLTLIATGLSVYAGNADRLPAILGGFYAAFGAGLAINTFVSVLAPYALPETANPFAINTGAGLTKSLLTLLAMVGSVAAAMPVGLAVLLLDGAWSWVLLPVGTGYGAGAAALGCYLAGDVLDRRLPEVLAAVTPRR